MAELRRTLAAWADESLQQCDGTFAVAVCEADKPGYWTLDYRLPDLAAAVPFYGTQPPLDQVAGIKAPLLIHYAGLDTHVNEGWPAYENALKENKKEYTAYIYPNVNHGFHNDTTPRYDKAAAELAWQRTMDFFTEKLS